MEDEISEELKLHSSNEQSMVVIRHSLSHDYPTVFPPVNHEGLHISHHQTLNITQSLSSSPSSSSSSPSPSNWSSSSYSPSDETEDDPQSFSPSDDTGDDPKSLYPSNSQIRSHSDVSSWFRTGFEISRSKVLGIVSSFRNYAVGRGTVWSFGYAAGVVTAVIVSLLYRWVRRRRSREGSLSQLINLLKERDEKIIQLLQQIARINEVLLARHSLIIKN